MLFLYILLGLIFIFTALSFLRIYAQIDYEYINKTQKAMLTISFLKFIKIRIPFSFEKDKKKTVNNKKKKKQNEKKSFSFERLKSLFNDIKTAFSDSKSDIFQLAESIKKNLSIDKIRLEISFGLSDAAKTGMANGAIWAAAAGALSAIDNFSEIKSGGINIYPVFDRECLDLRLCGIISLRFAHIISIGITILKIITTFTKNLAKDK